MRGGRHRALKGLAIFGLVIIAITVLSLIVMLLWNALVPSLFHGPTIGYWQAMGLLVLSRILFGGFKGRHGPHGHGRWKYVMRERWESMTPEERARVREKFQRCRWGVPDQPDQPEQPKT